MSMHDVRLRTIEDICKLCAGMHLDESGLPVENDPLSSHSSEEKKEVTEDIQAPTEYHSTPAYPRVPRRTPSTPAYPEYPGV